MLLDYIALLYLSNQIRLEENVSHAMGHNALLPRANKTQLLEN